MFSVEATFDPAGDAAVRAEWQTLAEQGLPSLASHRSPSNRPHVTFAVRESRPDPEALALVVGALPMVIELEAASTFGPDDHLILVRRVAVSPSLAALHADVDRLAGASDIPDAVTEPGTWTPHVTLARRSTSEQVELARPLSSRPLRVAIEAFRIWDSHRRVLIPIAGLR